MIALGQDSLNTRRTLKVGGRSYDYYSLEAAERAGLGDISRLPYSLKVLLENLLRFEDGKSVTVDDIKGFAAWLQERRSSQEINYRPARVLMQDFTGVPAVVDLAAMRAAMVALGGDPNKINPLSPVDLVIDHSVMVDRFATATALKDNTAIEMERNAERYAFLRWGQQAFSNFRVVPPGTGICHQVNLEHLAQVVWTAESDGATIAYPDTLVGTDSHTTMVNGLAVLGWGVGGIEAEAAMLGQPISMLVPEVIGFRLAGRLAEGATATDLVLTVVQMLRKRGVVGKFVEFYGPGLDELSLADQATIANMAPEYGATCGFFPIDAETINYLRLSARDEDRIALVEAYAKAQGMWRDGDTPDPVFTDTLELELGDVTPSISGPKRPQDKIFLTDAAPAFGTALTGELGVEADKSATTVAVAGMDHSLGHGDIVIAAITSCTNTSNPNVMLGAGLLARNAVKRGLKVKPWVKTSLAPGSKVVSEYLTKAGLQDDLDALGFNVVGYGCTTCIGNSGPLADEIVSAIDDGDLVVTSVLSGNRNFEGRISPHVRANYLASPPLVVAYAIAGSMNVDITTESLGEDADGTPVYLKDIWPSNDDVRVAVAGSVTSDMFREQYADAFTGSAEWQAIDAPQGLTYEWQDGSTYIKNPPYFDGMEAQPAALSDVKGARILALLGDSVTTDHISPAGAIKHDSPAGDYLTERQIGQKDFNSYGSRRGNHDVMMRGTFANVRIRNELAPGTEGGVTRHMPDGRETSMFEAAMEYEGEDTPLVVIAGKEYGTGSSRDWAAKGTRLLGVKAVIAESFERIHRSNLVGMCVLPLLFPDGVTRQTLGLDGSEVIDLEGVAGGVSPGMTVACRITRADGTTENLDLLCRIDTAEEAEYFRHGGILHYVLRGLAGLT
ncbi:MAG: Aconitate hydratase A [Alphaproteobacteria bacterium MarineAlpha10_Bin1]|nr:MAG: Aconitate hydratase A [Alphaproteobacteria bacterium MarineAlpha10_Bin1]